MTFKKTAAVAAALIIPSISLSTIGRAYALPVDSHNVRAQESAPEMLDVARLSSVTISSNVRYAVVSGDTLSGIASRHKTTYPILAGVNHVPNPNLIFPGQVLTVEGPAVSNYTGSTAPAEVTYHAASAPAVHTYSAPAVVHSAPAVVHQATSSYTPSSSYESCVISRESGGNTQVMNGSGHWGLYQFSYSTWVAYGGSPSSFGHASAATQHQVFANAMARGGESNWSPYDGC